jgi:Ca2+-binding RTX toxin-like protein
MQLPPSRPGAAGGEFSSVFNLGIGGQDVRAGARRTAAAGKRAIDMPRRLHSETGEFTVFNDVNHWQVDVHIAALYGGGYVVSWYDTYYTHYIQRFTSAGTAIGAPIQVAPSQNNLSQSAVAALEGGGFAFAWIDTPGGGGTPSTLKIQLYNSDGSAGPLVTDSSTTVQYAFETPVIGALAGGGFVVLHEVIATGQIAMRIFEADGDPVGPEVQLALAANSRGRAPTMLGLPDGRFVVVYEEESSSTGKSDIKLRLFQSDGTVIATTVVASGPQDQAAPQITLLPTGPLLITWQEQGAQGWDIRAGIFDAGTGLLEGASFVVNSQVAGDQTEPTVAALDDGEFIIAWVGPDASGRDLWESAIKGQVFAADGTRIGEERLLNSHLAGSQSSPHLVALEDGGVAAVWLTPSLPVPAPHIAVRSIVLDLVDVTVTAGGAGNDALAGTAGPDDISGFDGNDQISGGAGDDVLLGGGGGDTILGDAGNDEIDGGDGADMLDGGAGNDVLLGGEGDDILTDVGSRGFDRLDGGAGNDVLSVGAGFPTYSGAAVLIGGDGDDLFTISFGGGVGYNETAIFLDAGAGYDRIEVGNLSSPASFTLGSGSDTVAFSTGNFAQLGSFGNGGGLTITDFQTGAGGDRLEITALIDHYIVAGWDGVTNPLTAGVVALEQSGANTLLRIRSFPEYDFATYITFLNVSPGAFTNDNFDGLRVDGSAAVGVNKDGTADGDILVGTMGGEVINGLDGYDTIYLNAGNDTGTGGLGEDHIYGGSGNDTIDGGEDRDWLDGGQGNDVLSGGNGQDVVAGGYGDDVIDGGADNDSLTGGPGSDTYIVDSNSGTDSIDEIDSWLGTDRVRSSVGYTLNNGNGYGIEELELVGTANIDGTGNASANVLLGNSGVNKLYGLGGGDTLDGRGGADTLEGGLGDDIYVVGDSAAAVVELANEGSDEVRTTLAAYALGANLEKLTGTLATGQQLTGNELANIVTGGGGADTLSGGIGNDRLDGGAGGDSMTGGIGDDVFIVDNSGDQVIEVPGEGNDEVRTSLAAYVLHANVEKLTGLLTTGQALTGNGAANVIAGGIGNDVIDGGAGADQMAGGGGNDVYVVDEAGDSVTEVPGAGVDEVRTGLAVYALGANLENLTGTSDSGQQLTGNDRANTIAGGAGADVMAGGLGDDVYLAGAGDVVSENANAGTDEVRTALPTYTLGVNLEKLTGTLATGQILTGNGASNVIAGASGGDRIDGGAGADTMAGGEGDDIYVVDDPGDVVTELPGQGYDEVRTGLAAYTLHANVEKLTGTAATGQSLTGNSGDNMIAGGAGNDILDGAAGTDSMFGGLGDDVYVFEGSDVVVEYANEGTDEIRTAGANFSLAGLPNIENLTGTSADLQGLYGNAGANRITGGSGLSYIDGGAGDDVMIGGLGDDTYIVDSLGDTVTELAGQGRDEVRTALAAYTLAANVEILFGTSGTGQALTGNAIDNQIEGGAGNDTLDGRDGVDTLYGFSGNDIYIVGAGDVVNEFANDGTDEVRTALFAYTLTANVEKLTGLSASGQQLTGNGSANVITGGGSGDRIDGGAGDDAMIGRAGDDTYFVDSAGDVVTELAGEGFDDIRTGLASYSLAGIANVERLTGTSGGQSLTGNALANFIFAATGNTSDVLNGGAGADNMTGYGGNDTYHVDNAGDITWEDVNGGSDTVVASADYRLRDNIENLQALNVAGSAPLSLTGNDLRNFIWGTQGNNVLDGAGGADFMVGYAGDDLYSVDNVGDVTNEEAGGGFDTVVTFISHTLSANVENLQSANIGGTAALSLTGNALRNFIWGTQGNNVLDGAGGADFMVGYAGDDLYVVDNLGDVTNEEVGGGFDTVVTFISYTLSANVENLQSANIGGTDPLSLTGNALRNFIWGTQGNNVLDGAGGADFMVGYGGDDLYVVDNLGDVTNEEAGGGFDTVVTFISHTLSANVENLQSANIGGTDPLALTGNELRNFIWGTQGNNDLNGAGGADFMVGYGGNDTYFVDDAGDVTAEEAGGGFDTVVASTSYTLSANLENLQSANIGGTAALSLTGNDQGNFIWGTQGNNVIAGRGGNDRLFGYAGADQFLFDTAAGNANFDWLDDFQAGTDKIVLDNSVFTALADGTLNANAFVTGTAAADADDRIIFNAADGSVYYDADGNGAGAALLVAFVPVGQALTANDFLVV